MIWFIPLCLLIVGFFIWKFYTSDSDSELSENNRIFSEKSKEVKDEIKRLAEEHMETGVDVRLAFSRSPSIDEHCLVFNKVQKIILNGMAYKFPDIIKYEVNSGQDTEPQKETKTRSGMNAAFGSSFYGTVGEAVKELTGKKEATLPDPSNSGKNDRVDVYVNDKNNPIIRLYVYPTQIEIMSTTLDDIIAKNQSGKEADVEAQPQTKVSIADELIKLKKLKEEGVLTEEEFTTQKSKLLNL